MGKTKKPAAAKRSRGTVAKTTKKSSKEPASVVRCPYASAALCIAQGGGDGREIYEGEHPATSAPECGKLLHFKVPRKWLDLNVEDFGWYTFCFKLTYKQGHSHTPRVYTRTQVINQDNEVKDLVSAHLDARLNRETTAKYPEATWKGRGDASAVRVAVRRKPRQNWKYQVKFLEASLQLGADGTVPESEFGPGPGEEGYSDSGDESESGESAILVDGIPYGEYMATQQVKARAARKGYK